VSPPFYKYHLRFLAHSLGRHASNLLKQVCKINLYVFTLSTLTQLLLAFSCSIRCGPPYSAIPAKDRSTQIYQVQWILQRLVFIRNAKFYEILVYTCIIHLDLWYIHNLSLIELFGPFLILARVDIAVIGVMTELKIFCDCHRNIVPCYLQITVKVEISAGIKFHGWPRWQ
jgi:hypothetical protein